MTGELLKRIGNAALITACALFCKSDAAPYCGPVTVGSTLKQIELEGESFSFEEANITRYGAYQSDIIVAFIMDQHYMGAGNETVRNKVNAETEKIQRNIHRTLEELADENNARVLGLEGYEGEISSENTENLPSTEGKLLEMIAKAKGDSRKQLIETLAYKAGLFPIGYVFEMEKGDKIETYGVENKVMLETAMKIMDEYERLVGEASRNLEKLNQWDKLSEEEQETINRELLVPFQAARIAVDEYVIKGRSEIFVQNLLISYYGIAKQKGIESKVLILIGGAKHAETVAGRLDELKTPYIILRPESMEE